MSKVDFNNLNSASIIDVTRPGLITNEERIIQQRIIQQTQHTQTQLAVMGLWQELMHIVSTRPEARAVLQGSLDSVQNLLDRELSYEDRINAMTICIETNRPDILQALLRNTDLLEADRGNLVCDAASCGNIGIVRLLLANGPISSESRGIGIRAILAYGIIEDISIEHLENADLVVQALLQNGVISPEDRITAMGMSIDINRPDILQLLLADVEIRGILLELAVQQGEIGSVQTLLRSGTISSDTRNDAMREAVEQHDPDMLQLLLEGVEISEEDLGILLQFAVQANDINSVRILLENGPISSDDLADARKLAIEQNLPDILQLLLTDMEISEEDRGDLVVHAVVGPEGGDITTVRTLLHNGPIAMHLRVSAVLNAGERGYFAIMHLLLENTRLPQEQQEMLLYSAVERGDFVSVEALLNHEPISSHSQLNALHLALHEGVLEEMPEALLFNADLLVRTLLESQTASLADLFPLMEDSLAINRPDILQIILEHTTAIDAIKMCIEKENPTVLTAILACTHLSDTDRQALIALAMEKGNSNLVQILSRN